MSANRKMLGERLVAKGLISEADLKRAVDECQRSNKRLGDVLVNLGIAKEDDIALTLSEQMGIPLLDLSTYKFDQDCISLIDKKFAMKLEVIPVYRVGTVLTVAMEDPLDFDAIDKLAKVTKHNISPVFATSSSIKESIEKYYATDLSSFMPGDNNSAVSQMGGSQGHAGANKDGRNIDELIGRATEAPVIELVQKIIVEAIKMQASDIHLESQEKGFSCRYRVDGILQKPQPLPIDLKLAIISRIKIMSDIDISERRLPQDGRVQMNIQGKHIDLRVATFPTIHEEHVAIRILDKSKGILSLKQLGMDDKLIASFEAMIKKPYGMILVTGPTGSGKTTTLYSSLNIINDHTKNIITLEDPVEYSLENIHQSQVNVKAGLTFAVGLRSIVRLDPDVIMIGEIRDKETAEIAIHAALTGHLVFSTLHTNDAPSACARLINMGVEPYLLASSLTSVLAQRLVRKLCAKCKEQYTPGSEELATIGLTTSDITPEMKFCKAIGCEECQKTGYKGRIGIYELMIPDDDIKDLIVKKSAAHAFSDRLKQIGMKTLFKDGVDKIKLGLTSLSEVLMVTKEEN